MVPPYGLACCSNLSLSHTTCWLLAALALDESSKDLSNSFQFLRCVFYPPLQAMLLFVLSSSVFNPAAQQTHPGPALLPAEHSFFLPPWWVASLLLSSTGDPACSPNPSWSCLSHLCLLFTLKCQFASLGGGGCLPSLKNVFTDFVHSSSAVSHVWKELPANLHMLLVSENCSSPTLVREVLRPSTGHVHLSSSCLSCSFCSVSGQLQVP